MKKPSRTKETENWLKGRLKNGEYESDVIIEEGKKLGFSQSMVQKARERIDANTKKSELKGGWLWSSPNDELDLDSMN